MQKGGPIRGIPDGTETAANPTEYRSNVSNMTAFQPPQNRFEHEAAFVSDIAHKNFLRLRIMSMVALILFLLLLAWDIIKFFAGKWNESIGHPIITYSHSILILFLIGVLLCTRKRTPKNPSEVTPFHKAVTHTTLVIVLIFTVFLAVGDVMTSGSIAAYLGMVFAYAAIFILGHLYSAILLGLNMIVMVSLLVAVNLKTGQPMDIQIINAVAFTIAAFILSRVLFVYSRNDHNNQHMIKEQSKEISRQNDMKEELIRELRKALHEIKTLSGLLPICASCKKIRDDSGYWNQIEGYIQKHSGAQFSHGICPDCAKKLYPDLHIQDD